jgi:hypothetical protein
MMIVQSKIEEISLNQSKIASALFLQNKPNFPIWNQDLRFPVAYIGLLESREEIRLEPVTDKTPRRVFAHGSRVSRMIALVALDRLRRYGE